MSDGDAVYFSFGGGVQSTAALVLAAYGHIAVDTFLFANVGEDAENPDTLTYLRDIALPFAQKHNLKLVELSRSDAEGKPISLYQHVLHTERGTPIPIRMANGAPGNRSCTRQFKVEVTARYAKEHGATAEHPATMLIGISWDELTRAKTTSGIRYIRLRYPLIDMRLTREDCFAIIEAAGLPIPPKSSCWFCPFHKIAEWKQLRQEQPELFRQAVDLEQLLNERRLQAGKDAVYLTHKGKPLDVVIAEQAPPDETEETYSCGAFACIAS